MKEGVWKERSRRRMMKDDDKRVFTDDGASVGSR